MLPLILLMAIAGSYFANRFANLAYDKTLYRTALALADQVEVDDNKLQVDLPQIAKDLLEFDEDDDLYFRIIGPNGDLVSTNSKLPKPNTLPTADQHQFYNITLDNEKLREVVYVLPISTETNKASDTLVYVLVGETLKKREKMTYEIILGMLIPQIIFGALISFVIFVGVKRNLMPLESLRTEMLNRPSSDTSPISLHQAPDEIKPLIDAFNALLDRIKLTMHKQQQFIADASHQLKTPLAGLKTQAEFAMREKDSSKIQHALSQINVASSHLAHMVNQLLSLTKAEPDGVIYMKLERINLGQLAQSVTADWVMTALKKDIEIEFVNGAKSSFIDGNPALIKELINNLIDNAIRYSPEKSQITVGLSSQINHLRFFVIDKGIGISAENQHLVFERFYRVLGTHQDGSGLGLTIVKEIAERHGALVTLVSVGENKGCEVSVDFKLSSDTE
jgi:two-component system, OmpR family, sensor histidine kinase TctE